MQQPTQVLDPQLQRDFVQRAPCPLALHKTHGSGRSLWHNSQFRGAFGTHLVRAPALRMQ